MKRLPLEKIGLVLLVATLLTNPLTGQYVNYAIDAAFVWLFSIGAYISIVGSVYLTGYMALRYVQMNKVRIPAKGVKTHQAGKFLEV